MLPRLPLTNDTIAYTYDELGRVTQRTINGSANQVDWTFDALGRVTSEENLLGEFTYTYDGVTNRLATVTYPNSQTSTYTYMNDENDHRLQTIHHKYPNASTLSKFDYTYDAMGNILTWRQQADSTAVLWKYGYDQADQLTSAVKESTATPATVLQRFAYAYDPAGNRTVEQIDDATTLLLRYATEHGHDPHGLDWTMIVSSDGRVDFYPYYVPPDPAREYDRGWRDKTPLKDPPDQL